MECPLHFEKNPSFVVADANNTNTKVNGLTLLLVLKNKKTGSLQSVLMHVYSNSGNVDKSISYSKRTDGFSGNIFYTDLNGVFINGWIYQAGKITKKSKTSETTNAGARIAPPPDDGTTSCQTVETMWYEQTCYYYTDNTFECTNWEYIGTTFTLYCPMNGGGGSVYTSKTLDEQLAEFDEKIEDSLINDCLKKILVQIKNLKNGKVGEIINKFSGEIPNWSWRLKEGTLSQNVNGTTDLMNGGALTLLDFNKLKTATNISIARTIIHESIHAFLTVYFRYDAINAQKDYPDMLRAWQKAKRPDYNEIQHDQMEKTFVNDIAIALKEYGLSQSLQLDDYVYNDLAWGGLDFLNNSQLTDSEMERIHNRLNAEQTNSKSDTESPAGKKACN